MALRQRPFKKPVAEVSRRTTPDIKLKDPTERYLSRHKDHDSSLDIPYWMSTGNTMLDCAISGGKGIPGGMLTVLVGDEQTGKSVELFLMMAICQMHGGFVHAQDSERRWTPGLASLTNVDTTDSRLWYMNQPTSLEEALQNIEDFCDDIACSPIEEFERPKLVVLDSIASLDPEPSKEDIKKGVRAANQPMGTAAFLTRFFKKKQIKLMRKRNFFMVWTNQLRDFVDMTGGPVNKFAPKKMNQPGGRALKHATSVRIETSKKNINDVLLAAEKEANEADFPAGDLLCYKITKNVVGPPLRRAFMPWFYHMGADELLGMFQWLYDTGYITWSSGKGGGYSMWGHAAPRQQWLDHLYSDADARAGFREYFKAAYLDLSLYKNSAVFGPG